MSLFDSILGQVGGNLDIGSIASKFGIDPSMAEMAVKALGQSHAEPGDTIEGAAAKTGMDSGMLGQIASHLGGEGGLGQLSGLLQGNSALSGLTGMLDKDGDGNPLNDLIGMAAQMFFRIVAIVMWAAPLGAVGPGVVVATFYGFHPDFVARAIPEVWEIANLTGDAHPIHIHLTQFRLLNRQDISTDANGDTLYVTQGLNCTGADANPAKRFGTIVKSPGVSRYRPVFLVAREAGDAVPRG